MADPGVLITQVFDKKSKNLKAEIAAFEKKLVELQKKYELGGFVTASKQEGDKLTVKVLPAATQPPGAAKKAGAAGGGWGAKSAKAVVAEVKQSVGWGPKK